MNWINPFQLATSEEQKAWVSNLRNLVTVFCPPDSELAPGSSNITDLPSANLNAALTFLKKPPTKFMVGQDKVADFWKLSDRFDQRSRGPSDRI
jgi:hypothetical protein